MRGAVVVDTNVVVAGLLTANDRAPTARILDGMLTAAFPFVLSESLLAEYRKVLARPALRKAHGLIDTELDTLLTDVALHAIILKPRRATSAPDPGDQFLWDLLAERLDLVLVTGDKLLLQDKRMNGRVISPRTFVEDIPGFQ